MGDRLHPPRFGFKIEASKSDSAPSGAGEDVMYPRPECCSDHCSADIPGKHPQIWNQKAYFCDGLQGVGIHGSPEL